MVDDYCKHNCRNNIGRFCRSFTGDRLFRGKHFISKFGRIDLICLVQGRRNNFTTHQPPPSRTVLLVDYYFFINFRNCFGWLVIWYGRFWLYGGIVLYVILILIIFILYLFTKTSSVILFWITFVFSRPLGAVVGDFLDKPIDHGGLALSRFTASAVLLIAIFICIFIAQRWDTAKK